MFTVLNSFGANDVSLINTEIRRIYKLAIRNKWNRSKLYTELERVTAPFYSKKQLADLITTKFADFDWLKEYTTTQQETDEINEYFNKNFRYYSRQKTGLNNDIIRIITNGLNQDLDDADMISQLESTLNKWQNHAKTIVNTAQQQFSMLKFKITSQEAGVEKFRYSGPPPQRPICKAYYQKEFTLKEIADISNRLGYDFFIERGLWNCRHFWEAVI